MPPEKSARPVARPVEVPESTRAPGERPVVIVTGAAGGIGEAVARRCADEGWAVIAVDRPGAGHTGEAGQTDGAGEAGAAAEAPPGSIHPLAADLAAPAACAELVDMVRATFGRLDGLVNCAGVMRRGTLAESSEEDWDACFEVNARAVFRLCRAALPLLTEGGGGAVVNIASQWGLTPAKGHIAYSASKAAVVSLTQSIARDHGAEGIRANAICPGEILTPMVRQKMADGGLSEADLAASVPVGRLGRPADVAELTVFLLGDRAGYMNGAAVELTGGQTVA